MIGDEGIQDAGMVDAVGRLIFARRLDGLFETRFQHARAVNAGLEQCVGRGAYFPASSWERLDARERYLVQVHAIARTRRNPAVLSHWSAAAVHGLPLVGDWPAEVHTIVGPTSGGRSRNHIIKHSLRLGDADVMELDGMMVTTVARTILDMAVAGSFMVAVTMADRAVHVDRFHRIPPLTTKDEIRKLWEANLPFRGSARSLAVIDFAETRADSPIESVSRVNMRVSGCPRPQLQTPFSDHQGWIGETDFYWPEFEVIGEADGDVKYLDPRYRAGRTADQVVLDEKVREDRLRALGRTVSRWRWMTASHPVTLRRHLEMAGIRVSDGRTRK